MRIAYKHTSKAGGTYLDRVLRDVFGQSYVAYGEGPADMNRSAELYLIGSVRNPCAWLVSMWGYSWRQSCKRMYTQPTCALTADDAAHNFADEKYWKSTPGACLSMNAVTSCAGQYLRACLRQWAAEEGLLPSAGAHHAGTGVSHVSHSTVRAFALHLTEGGARLNASRVASVCAEAGRTPWNDGVRDFAEYARSNLNYQANIMAPFFQQPGMPHGLHAAWKHTPSADLTPEQRALTRPRALADCWVYVERMHADLLACVDDFSRRGGHVDWARVSKYIKPEPINPSEHSTCTAMFPERSRPHSVSVAVERTQRGIFETFGYRTCCDVNETVIR